MQNKEEKVNINTASKEELITLSGIGDSKALAIIEYRKNNPFTKEFPNAATLYKYIDQCKLIKKLTY